MYIMDSIRHHHAHEVNLSFIVTPAFHKFDLNYACFVRNTFFNCSQSSFIQVAFTQNKCVNLMRKRVQLQFQW